MRRRREYPLAVIFGLFVMGLAAAGVGAALLLTPPSGYAPNVTPTPRATPTPYSEDFPSFAASPTPSVEPTAIPTPTPDPTAEATPEPTTAPTAEPTTGDIYAERRSALPACEDRPNCGVHTAVEGDWLSRLAIYYGVEMEAIEAFNPQIDDPNHIAVGEQIRIPR